MQLRETGLSRIVNPRREAAKVAQTAGPFLLLLSVIAKPKVGEKARARRKRFQTYAHGLTTMAITTIKCRERWHATCTLQVIAVRARIASSLM